MLTRAYDHRSQPQRKGLADHGPTARRPRFETLEDRCLLSFTPVATFDTGPYPAYDVVAADFNNDGHLDLATANLDDVTVSVLLGDGQGGFGEASLFGVGDYPRSVAVGDFNEDGKLDLAAANQLSGDVSVLLGNGDGTFGVAVSVPAYGSPMSVAVGDFNADGKLDLGVASYGYGFLGYYGYASVHAGDGKGNFAEPKTTVTYFAEFESATAVDLDGDGADELVVGNDLSANSVGAVHVFRVDASGYPQPYDVLFIGQDQPIPPYYHREANDVAVGDLNGDDVADIVTANTFTTYGVSVLLGDGLGGYGAEQTYAPGDWSESLVLGDVTGDGNIDIAYESHGVNLLQGNGDGTFSTPVQFPAVETPAAMAAGDFNVDGWLDIITGNWSGTVSLLLNDRVWGQVNPNPLPGDYNDNGTVDAADYVVWRKTQGTMVTPYSCADGNGSGMVGPEDYDVWKSHFGQTLPPPGAGSDATVTEVNTAAVNTTFTLPLSNAAPVDVTVHDDTEVAVATGSGFVRQEEPDLIAVHVDSGRPTVIAIPNIETTQEAVEPREARGKLVTPRASLVTSTRVAGHILPVAGRPNAANRHEAGLVAWLASPPTAERSLNDLRAISMTEERELHSTYDTRIASIDQVLTLIDRDSAGNRRDTLG